MTQDPSTQDPSTQDPSTQDPSTQDPSTQDPSTQDPSELTPELFLKWYPEFGQLPEGVVEHRLMLSSMLLSKTTWGKLWKLACALWSAHYLALRYDIQSGLAESGVRSPTSTIGVTTSRSASTSGLSEGSSVSGMLTGENPIEVDLARTEYGLEFLNLVNMWMPPGAVVYSLDTSSAEWDRS